MLKSLAVVFKKFFIAWKMCHTIYEKEKKNWSRRHELKPLMKINILVNTDHLTISYIEKDMFKWF